MLNKNILLLLLCSAFVGISLQAEPAKKQKTTVKQEATKKAEKTPKKKLTTENEEEDTEDQEDTEFTAEIKLSAAERSKCHRLSTTLVGERFDGGKVAAFLASNTIGYGIESAILSTILIKKIKNAFPNDHVMQGFDEEAQIIERNPLAYFGGIALKIGGTILAMNVASICIHLGLLKPQKVSALTSTYNGLTLNPAGLAVYSVLHRLVLSSNLIKILKSYDHDQIPACVKTKFNKLIHEYEDTNSLEMSQFQRASFVIEILAELDKAMAR